MEKKEVSNTLRKLRMKYDSVNKLVRQRERELEQLKVSLLLPITNSFADKTRPCKRRGVHAGRQKLQEYHLHENYGAGVGDG